MIELIAMMLWEVTSKMLSVFGEFGDILFIFPMEVIFHYFLETFSFFSDITHYNPMTYFKEISTIEFRGLFYICYMSWFTKHVTGYDSILSDVTKEIPDYQKIEREYLQKNSSFFRDNDYEVGTFFNFENIDKMYIYMIKQRLLKIEKESINVTKYFEDFPRNSITILFKEGIFSDMGMYLPEHEVFMRYLTEETELFESFDSWMSNEGMKEFKGETL